MSRRIGTAVTSKKKSMHPQIGKKMEFLGCKSQPAERNMANQRLSTRDRKLALLQDVDHLKKKLRREESVHRALERAFSRPFGALPHLPSYLPQHTVELVAEVAVLEEEIIRLEEQVVSFRQGLCIISRRRANTMQSSNESSIRRPKQIRHSRSFSQNEVRMGSFLEQSSPSLSLSGSASPRKLLFEVSSQRRMDHVRKRNPRC